MARKIYIIFGPSGVGKGTIIKELLRERPRLRKSISHTTRPKASKEVEGEDYFFVTKEEFERKIRAGDFVEWAWYPNKETGNLYGTAKTQLDVEEDVLLELDMQGVKSVVELYPDAILILISANKETRKQRMIARGRDNGELMDIRLETGEKELQFGEEIGGHIIENKDGPNGLEDALKQVLEIVK